MSFIIGTHKYEICIVLYVKCGKNANNSTSFFKIYKYTFRKIC